MPFIGYWLGTPHWGKGYATEAVQALIDTLFTLLEIPAIEADTRVINPASRRVLEKSGFRQEGSFLKSLPARGGLFPCEQYPARPLDLGCPEELGCERLDACARDRATVDLAGTLGRALPGVRPARHARAALCAVPKRSLRDARVKPEHDELSTLT